jgi:hypothetical protein
MDTRFDSRYSGFQAARHNILVLKSQSSDIKRAERSSSTVTLSAESLNRGHRWEVHSIFLSPLFFHCNRYLPEKNSVNCSTT